MMEKTILFKLQMLKCALGERTREESSADEDQLSQHSDSVMDYRERKAEPGSNFRNYVYHIIVPVPLFACTSEGLLQVQGVFSISVHIPMEWLACVHTQYYRQHSFSD